jgi:hypothetical protein
MLHQVLNEPKQIKASESAIKLVKSEKNQVSPAENARRATVNEKTAAKTQINSLNKDMKEAMQNNGLNQIMQIDEPVINENYFVSVPTEMKPGGIRDTERIISRGFLAINN